MAERTVTEQGANDAAPMRELMQSVALLGLLFAGVGAPVGIGLLAVRVFAG